MFGNNKSDLQKEILRTFDRNPDMSAEQIASKCDCSASYVRETVKEYRGGPLGGNPFDTNDDALL